jgi:mRNA interferase RelE/StbE
MPYEVRFTDTACEDLEKLDKSISKRIIDKLEIVANDPFSFVKKLKGCDFYRLRVGDYRVIMSIENQKMVIFIIEVGHRSSIYRKY